MKEQVDISNAESLSAYFDGVIDDRRDKSFSTSDREKWKTYSLISDVIENKQSETLHISNFSEIVRNRIENEPCHSKYNVNSIINFLKRKLSRIPVLVAAPALAVGLVVFVVQPQPVDEINLADDSEMPLIMESYCQLHENVTGGAALC